MTLDSRLTRCDYGRSQCPGHCQVAPQSAQPLSHISLVDQPTNQQPTNHTATLVAIRVPWTIQVWCGPLRNDL